MPTGRPTLYTPEIAAEICSRLMEGESLRSICRDPAMPAKGTVRGWALENRDGFGLLYARAREIQSHEIADEMLEIADDGSNDWMRRTGKDGEPGWELNGEHIQRSRARIDARKWLLSKMLPRVYGDKVQHTGADGAGPVAFVMYGAKEAASTDDWLAIVAADNAESEGA